ncbi:MAG: sensor histidine kinase [Eubacteriales bacterium]|nr:sensor histidine kinase [Eubacteriales bacterium]
MNFFKKWLWQRRYGIYAFGLFCAIFFCAFALYHLPLAAVAYPVFVCAVLGAVFLALDFRKAKRKHERLLEIEKLPAAVMDDFPEAETLEDTDYQQIIQALRREQTALENEMNEKYTDMVDYYTVWAHQIKTPIASMQLSMQREDSDFSRRLSADLFRIEQYVEMVLMFLRLDSDSTDYVFEELDLDSLIRQTVKKFSGEFYRRKLSLIYEPVQVTVLTDEKWLAFVIEQVLSNALKYTHEGAITIEVEESKTLCIRDTGIGIAPEDLPRIFEKGYTGYNGRTDKRASGIGLYLCKRICKNLGHRIFVDSAVDEGTVVRICLQEEKLDPR